MYFEFDWKNGQGYGYFLDVQFEFGVEFVFCLL